MPYFLLDVEVMAQARAVSLRLSDEHGRHVGANQVRLDDHPARSWEGLFDTRSHARRFAGVLRAEGKPGSLSAAKVVEHVGAFLGEHVLGPAIVGALSAGIHQRTLLVRLPDPSGDPIAAALARVPWEIARPARGESAERKPLWARNVAVRAVLAGALPSVAEVAVDLRPDEALRVLLVYAEAPGSRPLAARLERERLLSLFASDVMPKRRVTVDALCHGVTRERLRAQIQGAGGYHVVHWSGHGEHDALELASEGEGSGPAKDVLRGAELVDLFASAGGFIPRLIFLSACHSGSFVGAKDWGALQAWLRDPAAAAASFAQPSVEDPSLGRILEEGRSHTGVALEMLRAGVPQVVAMRFEVGDAYARELAIRFYRCLLGQQRSHAVDAALAMARGDLMAGGGARDFHPVDHATPLLFGAAPMRFEPAQKRSPQMDRLRPRPSPLLPDGRRDLDPRPDFVGRGAELARLSATWLAASGEGSAGDAGSARSPSVAWIDGPEGIGKTALATEVIHLWHGRFDWVLAFQPDGSPSSLDAMYLRAAAQLKRASRAYRERCGDNELAKVYLEPGPDITGDARYELLRDNLADAMLAERILLVFDGFVMDAAWERMLSGLAGRVAGGGSRVLVTSRSHPPEVLADRTLTLALSLGPLPAPEAALFFEGSAPLRDLLAGTEADQAIARRILAESGGHPPLLKRLGELLAGDRASLESSLDRIAEDRIRAGLPELFAASSAAPR